MALGSWEGLASQVCRLPWRWVCPRPSAEPHWRADQASSSKLYPEQLREEHSKHKVCAQDAGVGVLEMAGLSHTSLAYVVMRPARCAICCGSGFSVSPFRCAASHTLLSLSRAFQICVVMFLILKFQRRANKTRGERETQHDPALAFLCCGEWLNLSLATASGGRHVQPCALEGSRR